MAKKKKNNPAPQTLSPEKYIQTKARNLPVEECLIGEDWQKAGLTTIVITRRHTNGNYTLGVYLVDLFCLGVKSSVYYFNISPEEYKEYKEHLSKPGAMLPVTYNEAHNIIFGSIAYAEELGIEPCKEFKLTQYLLEEDTDDIPLIDYEFGKDGKPCLIVATALEGSRYLPLLEKATDGNFRYFIRDEEFVEENENWPRVDYAYLHPDYPVELHLTHQKLMQLFDTKYKNFLDKEVIDNLLALPRETLIADLEHIILYETGRMNKELEEDTLSDDYEFALMHSMNLLAELKSEESLNTVLEVMRQDVNFMEVMFGDIANILFPHILYHVGANKLDKLQNYLMEPGLNTYFRYFIFLVVRSILEVQPERREEIIAWWRNVLKMFIKEVGNTTVYDAGLIGMMMVDLMDIKAVELLPEIEQLFTMDKVDIHCSGDYKKVKSRIESDTNNEKAFVIKDIYTWYADFGEQWGVDE